MEAFEVSLIRNLIFEGGGCAGIAYGGALTLMDDHKLLDNVERVGGTSAGAITACLMAIGYSASEIQGIIKDTKFSSFQDDSFGVIRDSVRLMKDYGWHKGETFKEWLGEHITEKFGYVGVTFADLDRKVKTGMLGMKHLYVVGTNLTKQRSEIYSHETTPDMLIVDAVRISMGIPFFFQCVKNKDGDILVDGGVANNYPIKMFDKREYYNPFPLNTHPEPGKSITNAETLGFRLDTQKEIDANETWGNVAVEIDDLSSYIGAVLAYFMETANKKHLTDADRRRTIFIDKAHIKATDFDLTEEDVDLLTENGRNAVKKFFGLDSV
jgi:NTE family protein